MSSASSTASSTDLMYRRFLRWVNLRPEEAERTALMVLFNITVFIGGVWLEGISDALFLSNFAIEQLPFVYIAISIVVTALGLVYPWLQRLFPLRPVMLGISLFVALPPIIFWFGLTLKGTPFYLISIFASRLWVDAVYLISYINGDIAANQLFNIREIKRTFPLISAGVTSAEIISGYSLPLMVRTIGTENVALAASIMLILATMLLLFISQRYRQAFPNSVYSETDEVEFATPRLQGNLRHYVSLLFGFFIVGQMLFFLVAYQYFSQLELNLKTEANIASFVGIFGGTLGLVRLGIQLFGASRAVQRLGFFATVLIPPAFIVTFGTLAGIAPFNLFFLGFVALRGFDDVFRYTLVANSSPVFFQAVPDQLRSRIQSLVRGLADPISSGVAGLSIWGIAQFFRMNGINAEMSSRLFAAVIVLLATLWIANILFLRRGYLDLLIQSVERGQLSLTDVDERVVRRAVTESLVRAGSDADKHVCIELLAQVAPRSVGESLAPLLIQMTPELQKQSLESMLVNPEPRFLNVVRELLQSHLATPQVRSLCLRYALLADPNPDVPSLRSYLGPEQNPLIRSTAVAMMMRLGTPAQVAEATNTLRQMITSPHQPERVLGCQALAEAAYMQSLRFYVPQLLQDPSIEVRCALLKAIAATRAEEYFPSIIRGLHYKATRHAAYEALVKLGDNALPSLIALSEDAHRPENVRLKAWEILGAIGSSDAIAILAERLPTHWARHRRTILHTLIRIPKEAGIRAAFERIGRNGVETMVKQELTVMGEAWAAIQDFSVESTANEFDLLYKALYSEIDDSLERLFLQLKLVCPPTNIQAAAFNIMSGSKGSLARGIEILDNTIDLSTKQIVLAIVDKRSIAEKLRLLAEVYSYQPMSAVKRLRHLLEIQHCLSDWTLACCFHASRAQLWSLPAEDTLAGLEHPTGFVREAVMSYLQVVSPRSLRKLLPKLQHDRDLLVGAQARAIAAYYDRNDDRHDDRHIDYPIGGNHAD